MRRTQRVREREKEREREREREKERERERWRYTVYYICRKGRKAKLILVLSREDYSAQEAIWTEETWSAHGDSLLLEPVSSPGPAWQQLQSRLTK
ncbi:hypothetical protein FHG87_013761 [Trinorchestia longiramus]|nr:hypothetical protein FHG87_013761 [Trinorchestia longiramus]